MGGLSPALGSRAAGLVAAAHAGPTLVVTALAGLLGFATGLPADRWVVMVVAVFAGQLSIGWSNDLVDLARDRAVGRTDKPLALDQVPLRWVQVGCAVSLLASAGFSLACGLPAALAHAVVVGAGWAYNLGLKSTVWSWLPYAIAFGALPVFVALSGTPGQLPPWWWPVGAALLGVGAHLLNVLPDLDDDARTGVRGLPHRLGARSIRRWSVLALSAASAVALAGSAPPLWAVTAAVTAVLVLAVVMVRGRGRTPFVAGIGIALIDVLLLVLA